LTSLTVVLLLQVVGLVLVIALLTLPAATAGFLTRRLWQMMVVAAALSLLFTVGGLAISYGPDLPPGATIIELAGTVYVLGLIGRKCASAVRRRSASK
jgi:zinc transport system permease protein